jgi:hypothetical protein
MHKISGASTSSHQYRRPKVLTAGLPAAFDESKSVRTASSLDRSIAAVAKLTSEEILTELRDLHEAILSHYPDEIIKIINLPNEKLAESLTSSLRLSEIRRAFIMVHTKYVDGWLGKHQLRYETAYILQSKAPATITQFCENYRKEYANASTIDQKDENSNPNINKLEICKKAIFHLMMCRERLQDYCISYPHRQSALLNDATLIEDTLNYFNKEKTSCLSAMTAAPLIKSAAGSFTMRKPAGKLEPLPPRSVVSVATAKV